MVIKVARFGDTTRSRLDLWFAAHRIKPSLTWTSDAPGLFDITVPIRLSVESESGIESYAMTVNPETREVRGLDESSRSLLARVRAWAETL